MKKFSFRLQSVLEVRTLHKKLAERELAQTRSRISRNNQELEENQHAYRQSFETSKADNPAVNAAFWLDANQRYRASLEARREVLEERKKELTQQLEADQVKLTRKMKEEMVIQKLEEYQRTEHQREVESALQQEIEEIDLLKRGAKK
jgi:flagellar export protein FliJ